MNLYVDKKTKNCEIAAMDMLEKGFKMGKLKTKRDDWHMTENSVFEIYTENEKDFRKIPKIKVRNPIR